MNIYTLVLCLCIWLSTLSLTVDSAGELQFYMDKSTDCNGPQREVGEKASIINGRSKVAQEQTALSCELRLYVDSPRDPRKFTINVNEADIQEQDVSLHIYDGDGSSSRLLGSFSYGQGAGSNYPALSTTGNLVTFRLDRQSKASTRYNITLRATPIPGDTDWSEECPGGICNNVGGSGSGSTWNPLQNKELLIGIVAGCFAVVLIVIAIVVICCYRKQTGVNRRWEEDRLGNINPDDAFHSSNETLGDRTKGTWISDNPRNGYNFSLSQKGRMAGGSEDGDSNISETASMPRRRAPTPPPSYTESNKQEDESRQRPKSTKHENGHRKRQTSDQGVGDTMETSFTQANDDHPQEEFKERIIVPRVRTKSKAQWAEPPTEPDQGPDTEDQGVQCEAETSDEPRSEDEVDKVPVKVDIPSQPKKKRRKKRTKKRQTEPVAEAETIPKQNPEDPPVMTAVPQPVSVAQPMNFQGYPPGVYYPQPQYGYPVTRPPMHPQFAPPPYPHGQPHRPPFHPGPNQFQPVQYAQPPHVARQPHHVPHSQPAMNPSNRPVYSYLVQRGYTPQDGRHSPASTSTATSHNSDSRLLHTDESDVQASLESGVELMRRQHTMI